MSLRCPRLLMVQTGKARHLVIERHAGGESSSLTAAGPPVAASAATEFPHCVHTLRMLLLCSIGNERVVEYVYHSGGL